MSLLIFRWEAPSARAHSLLFPSYTSHTQPPAFNTVHQDEVPAPNFPPADTCLFKYIKLLYLLSNVLGTSFWVGKQREVGRGVQELRRGGRYISQFIKVTTTGTLSFTKEVQFVQMTHLCMQKREKVIKIKYLKFLQPRAQLLLQIGIKPSPWIIPNAFLSILSHRLPGIDRANYITVQIGITENEWAIGSNSISPYSATWKKQSKWMGVSSKQALSEC